MSNSDKYPIDVDLWKKERSARQSERWKWAWTIWDPIIDAIYRGETGIGELKCPVCGHNELYFYFLVFHIAVKGSLTEGRTVYIADRFYGCRNCQTQVRDYGRVPPWVKDEEVTWVSEKAKKIGERELGLAKQRLASDRGT